MKDIDIIARRKTAINMRTTATILIIVGVGITLFMLINNQIVFTTYAELLFWSAVLCVYSGLILIVLSITTTRKV